MDQDTKYALLDDIELDLLAVIAYDDDNGIIGIPVNVNLLENHGYIVRNGRPIGATSQPPAVPRIHCTLRYTPTQKGKDIVARLCGSGAEKVIAIREILNILEQEEHEKQKYDNEEGF